MDYLRGYFDAAQLNPNHGRGYMDNFYDVLYADASVGGLADPAAEVRVSTSIITTTRGKQIKDILEKRLSPRGYRE